MQQAYELSLQVAIHKSDTKVLRKHILIYIPTPTLPQGISYISFAKYVAPGVCPLRCKFCSNYGLAMHMPQNCLSFPNHENLNPQNKPPLLYLFSSM